MKKPREEESWSFSAGSPDVSQRISDVVGEVHHAVILKSGAQIKVYYDIDDRADLLIQLRDRYPWLTDRIFDYARYLLEQAEQTRSGLHLVEKLNITEES